MPFLSFKFRYGVIEGKLALEKVRQEVVAVPDNMKRQTVNEMAKVALTYIQDAVAEHTKTGVLASSLKWGQTPNKRGRQIYHDDEIAPYAKWLIGGSKPHRIPSITNTSAKPLAFFWEKIGQNVVFDHVNHPGYKGHDYFTEAYEAASIQFAAIMSAVDPFSEKE